MFCQKCGNQLSEDVKFCNQCGNTVGNISKKENTKSTDDNTVILNVKSKFKFLYHSLGTITLFVIILLFSFVPAIVLKDLEVFIITVLCVFGALVFISLLWGISLLFVRAQFKRYNYDFYSTKVIYTDSFLNVSEKEVKYKFIREIVFTQSFYQRFFNLGNIMLYTNAESGFSNGILIRSVDNVKEVYNEIKKVVNI